MSFSHTFFFSQLLFGQEECVQSLLQLEASVLLGDSKGRTAIHLAAARGHASWLSELLNIACAEPPVPPLRDNQGYTPLHWACYFGQISIRTFYFIHCISLYFGGPQLASVCYRSRRLRGGSARATSLSTV